jgi:DNA-directed RNA polymerase specialized sigma24 family protein
LSRLVERKPGSVEDVFERCWKIVWPTVYSVVQIAEDAAQEAMSRIFRGLDTYDVHRPLEPWVRRIAVNSALNELRKERRAPVPIEWVAQLENAESTDNVRPA